jgi:hypothetical protein
MSADMHLRTWAHALVVRPVPTKDHFGTGLPIRNVRCHGEYRGVERTKRGHRENGEIDPFAT